MQLNLDIATEHVRIGGEDAPGRLDLTGQWVDFYALLSLSLLGPDPLAQVTADALARVGPWRHKASASVGKEVARHLSDLARRDLGGMIACTSKTRAWRLALPPGRLVLRPDRVAVRTWLDGRVARPADSDGWIGTVRTLVDVSTVLQQGDGEDALRRLDGLPALEPGLAPALEAWSALLRGRALQLYDEDDDRLHELHDRWCGRVDAPGRATGVRLRAMLARRHRFEDPEATRASLAKVAADLELRGDVGSLAVVENVMGLLARRAGQPGAAASHLLRAAALFGISGDHPALQGALFNLAICRRDALRGAGRPPDEAVLDLIELCRLVCARFGVGNDSAQAEIAGAEWAFEMGDLARARRYLETAAALLGTIDAIYDQAYFLEVRAQIAGAEAGREGDRRRDLRSARGLYLRAGDRVAAKRVERLLEHVAG